MLLRMATSFHQALVAGNLVEAARISIASDRTREAFRRAIAERGETLGIKVLATSFARTQQRKPVWNVTFSKGGVLQTRRLELPPSTEPYGSDALLAVLRELAA
jgi:hypothetical protein